MSVSQRVALLVGGVGGAKLAVGLAKVLPPERLSIIINTADDLEHLGLAISPDLDTVMYSLSGLANPITGWGVAGDTFQAMEMVSRAGGPAWFRLGDCDLGVNLMRTSLLRSGRTLTEATAALSAALGVRHPLLPMSDDRVQTWLKTDAGEMGFQEYFVREHWQPVVREIGFKGAQQAQPTAQARAALESATLIVLGPSNPYLSIDPILALPGVREMITGSAAPCVAVSPIVGGRALKGPAAKLMSELGLEISPVGIARHYDGVLDGIIIDRVDRTSIPALKAMGVRVLAANTVMNTPAHKTHLARTLLRWAEGGFD